jgi:hypothetical protein
MRTQAGIDAARNLASGFLISARLAFEAGDLYECRRMEAQAAAYEREADMAQRGLEAGHRGN